MQYLDHQKLLQLQVNSCSVQAHQMSVALSDPTSIDYHQSNWRDLAPTLHSFFRFLMEDNQPAMRQYTVSAEVDELAIHCLTAYQVARERESACRHLKQGDNVHHYA